MPELKRCPVGSIDPATDLLLGWWQRWRLLGREALPFDGALMDQPAWVVEAFELSEAAWADVERAGREDEKAKTTELLEGLRRGTRGEA